ncbi:hypothetical protein LSCM1_02600 [Leishmania martiniquensis]|uniref:CW-type domain-containing protein n=1 Tax=Leishmania martiniquensis TaxID=1580590 RepID=A0A836GSZ5_9TRYP|nr:hypothetical protein LSCM1_02600 [Leishmania martiniquensis]
MKSALPHVDRSSAAAPAREPTSAVAGAATGTTGPSTPHGLQTEPRYIRLPDVLYTLRHRYPSVTESVFLECTRCHQWVAVPVLRAIPNEIAAAVVSTSAAGLDPISDRTAYSGPLRHSRQDVLRRREELANDTATPQWRSRRLQEKQSHLANDEAEHNGDAHGGDTGAVVATSQHSFFESILQQLRGSRCPPREDAEDSTAPISEGERQRRKRHAPLYIPNPDTFICAGWQCAWDADALSDLRRDWLQSIYRALPMPPVCEESLALSSDESSSPSSPSVSFVETLRQRRASLNEALAQELNVGRRRRYGRGIGQRAGRTGRDLESQGSLPPLALPETAAERETALSRMQGSWVRAAALHLLRSSGSAGEGCTRAGIPTPDKENEALRHRHSSVEDDCQENVLSAYCWAVCDACGKLRRVAQPFPGGAPFVCAMAVTASSSCRATRVGNTPHPGSAAGIDQACSVSEMEGLMQCNMKLCEAELIYAALSSPFLPYPLKAQLGSLSRRQVCVEDPQESTERHSRDDVARVLLSEPLLRTIQWSVRESVMRGSPSRSANERRHTTGAATGPAAVKPQRHSLASSPDDASAELEEKQLFIYRSLPILRELARCIKARSISSFVRQLQLTPAQIQAKREAVMLDSFLSSHLRMSATGGGTDTAEQEAQAMIATASEAAPARLTVSLEEVEATRADPAACSPSRPSGTRTKAPLPKSTKLCAQEGEMAAVKREPGSSDGVNRSEFATPPGAAKRTRAPSRPQLAHKALQRPRGHPQDLANNAGQQPPPRAPRIAPRKRERSSHQGPEKSPRSTAHAYGAITEVAANAGDVSAASPRGCRRQRCEVVSQEKRAASGEAAAEKAVPVAGEGSSPALPPLRRPRGRAPGGGSSRRKPNQSSHGGSAEKKSAKDEKWEVVHWVQCDRCSKWRIVPRRISAKVKFWECAMRYDKKRGRATTCDDADDADLTS